MSVSGSCLCGQVRFTVIDPMRPVIACHCQQCRKTSGHYVAAAPAPRDGVRVEGDVTWYPSSSIARRGFCATCGSSLFWDGPGTYLSIHAGTLDGPTGLYLAGHIYCTDKGDYYDIADGQPQVAQDDPESTTQVP